LRVLGFLVVLLVLAVLSSQWMARPIHDGRLDNGVFQAMTIASPERAVTLARARSGAVLLVTALDAEGVAAIDVGAAVQRRFEDSLQAYAELGIDGLRRLYGTTAAHRYRWKDLGIPVKAIYPHVATGTNYSAHAEEVGHEGDPFLFPKLSRPTPWDSPVASGWRLDYEVELCAVLLGDHTPASPAPLGYVLCGDFTDRWLLVRDIDLDGPMGRTGFSLAKGGESRFPIGPLLVIPEDDDFYRELALSLYVNDELRQSSGADKMIWSPREILSRAIADCRVPYDLESRTVYLGECDYIPAGTLLLTGTPEGVLFHPATIWNPAAYLGVGDVVTSFGTHLGFTRNVIEDT
jgi:2-keto-4-pentenoate hydratase/2-oxohepta-3-ene-1,7-dioic acid hydratase in catechol pathway